MYVCVWFLVSFYFLLFLSVLVFFELSSTALFDDEVHNVHHDSISDKDVAGVRCNDVPGIGPNPKTRVC